MRRGFTLLELIVVIIIIGVLATLGFTQYTKMVEKGRTAEAKSILGQIRSAEVGAQQENGAYSAIGSLPLSLPTSNATCDSQHYYWYDAAAASGTGTATRCTSASGAGKNPVAAADVYNITLTAAGVWSGSAGYF